MARPASHRLPTRIGAFALGCAVVLAVVVGTAAPAGADPVRPGGTESVVDSVTPAADGVEVEILGGDAFVQVTARRGTEVLIPGYSGEPYLRIRADGVVERNDDSPSVALNASRLGSADTAPSSNERSGKSATEAEPRWVPTGAHGRVAWHDHRIHWMAPGVEVTARDGVVQRWEVPLEVDGVEVVVHGRLLAVDAGPPVPLVLVASVAPAVALLARPRRRRLVVLGTAAVLAAVLGAAAYGANPPEASARPWILGLAVAAAALVVVAAAVRSEVVARVAEVGAISLLGGWLAVQAPVLWSSVVPTLGPGWAARLGTAVVAGAVLGSVAALLFGPVTVGPAAIRDAGSSPAGR